MARLELTRSPEDRRLYVLPGVGELRTRRWPIRDVEATAGGRTYTFALRGRKNVPTATDAFGAEVGHQDGSRSIVWRDVSWNLDLGDSPSYYTLTRSGDERQVANFALAIWGRQPVPIVVDETAKPDPGLLLFALFVMRSVVDDINRPRGGDVGPVG